jgi:16S rRNA (guanine527-N7)-methyltransferase
MSLDIPEQRQRGLVDYLVLLNKWNRTYNLTAVRDPQQMVSRQLLDSLSILPWMHGPSVIDVGCGAGLPGLPLALAMPDCRFTLLDSNGKKTRFVQQAATQLRLSNVEVVQARVEAYRKDGGFNTITSRAFADLHQMLELTAHLRAENGQWAAMKAGLEELDVRRLPPGCSARTVELQVPGETGRRHLVLVDGD